MSKKYALKGINEDETVCSVCGKVELKRVMWIVELDADGNELGDPFHCGTTCGAKLMGHKINLVNRVANSFASKVSSIRYSLQIAKERELGIYEILDRLNKETTSFNERRQHPLWVVLRDIQKEAKQWADSQEITINFE